MTQGDAGNSYSDAQRTDGNLDRVQTEVSSDWRTNMGERAKELIRNRKTVQQILTGDLGMKTFLVTRFWCEESTSASRFSS